MKNGDPYESPFFIGVICAPICVFCVSMPENISRHYPETSCRNT
jgi:hypothetical protein